MRPARGRARRRDPRGPFPKRRSADERTPASPVATLRGGPSSCPGRIRSGSCRGRSGRGRPAAARSPPKMLGRRVGRKPRPTGGSYRLLRRLARFLVGPRIRRAVGGVARTDGTPATGRCGNLQPDRGGPPDFLGPPGARPLAEVSERMRDAARRFEDETRQYLGLNREAWANASRSCHRACFSPPGPSNDRPSGSSPLASIGSVIGRSARIKCRSA